MLTTHVSLLDRIRDRNDRQSWSRFVELYSPLLFRWGRRLGLRDEDAADLAQDVLLSLMDKRFAFHHDGQHRFRSWLWTVTVNKCRETHRRNRPVVRGDLASLVDDREMDPADAEAEREYRHYLAARVMQIMQSEFEPNTWRACWSSTVEGRSASDVATELGMTVGAVYVAKRRVLRRIRQVMEEV